MKPMNIEPLKEEVKVLEEQSQVTIKRAATYVGSDQLQRQLNVIAEAALLQNKLLLAILESQTITPAKSRPRKITGNRVGRWPKR